MHTHEQLAHAEAIRRVLIRYAELCDYRLWDGFGEVFAADVAADYGGEIQLGSANEVRDMVKAALQDCGPTQHLLGNFRIDIDGNSAESRCYVRAVHAGKGERASLNYEVWGEYVDQLHLTDSGWRIARRQMLITHETGTRDVLWSDRSKQG